MPVVNGTFLNGSYGASDDSFSNVSSGNLLIGVDDAGGVVLGNGSIKFSLPITPSTIQSGTLTLIANADSDILTFSLGAENSHNPVTPTGYVDMIGRILSSSGNQTKTFNNLDPVVFDVTPQLNALKTSQGNNFTNVQFHLRQVSPLTGHAIQEYKMNYGGNTPVLSVQYVGSPDVISYSAVSGVGGTINIPKPTGVSSGNYFIGAIRSNSTTFQPPAGWTPIYTGIIYRKSGIPYSGGAIWYKQIGNTGLEPTGYAFIASTGRFCGIILNVQTTGILSYSSYTGVHPLHYAYSPNIYGRSGNLAIRIINSDTILGESSVYVFSGVDVIGMNSGVGLGVKWQNVVSSGNIGAHYFPLAGSSYLPPKIYNFSNTILLG